MFDSVVICRHHYQSHEREKANETRPPPFSDVGRIGRSVWRLPMSQPLLQ